MLNLYLKYEEFKKFKSDSIYQGKFEVLSQYIKYNHKNTPYFVLKLRGEEFTFYSTSWDNLRDLEGRFLELKLFTKDITFIDYISSFYSITFDLRLTRERTLKYYISNYIESKHSHPYIEELFGAIFLGESISREFRNIISNLGASHLLAISGFHISILSMIIFFILKYPYLYLQDRYFPYRNRDIDLTILTLSTLAIYLHFLGYIPSLIRAFVMALIGFLLYIRAIKILSFTTLLLTYFAIVSLSIEYLLSLSLFFSIAGVFYIFLFLQKFPNLNKIELALGINFSIFIYTLPIFQYFFSEFSIYKLLSPILSLIFVIFYPVEILLHLINLGDILDPYLIALFQIDMPKIETNYSIELLLGYITLSILAIFSRYSFYLLNSIAILNLLYLIYLYFK